MVLTKLFLLHWLHFTSEKNAGIHNLVHDFKKQQEQQQQSVALRDTILYSLSFFFIFGIEMC